MLLPLLLFLLFKTAQGVVQSTRQVGESKHGRVNAMAAANAGFDAYRAYQSGTKAVTDVKDFYEW